jgi:hypothetical protein
MQPAQSRTILTPPDGARARERVPLGGGRTSATVKERAIRALLAACSTISILTTAGIIAVLLFETMEFFRAVPLWDFLTDTEWTPLFADKHFGIAVLASATFLTSAIALMVALPVGLLTAVFLSELASERVRRTVKPVLEVLAGVPTVVYGYFALLFVTPLLQSVFPWISGLNGLSAGLVMGIMILRSWRRCRRMRSTASRRAFGTRPMRSAQAASRPPCGSWSRRPSRASSRRSSSRSRAPWARPWSSPSPPSIAAAHAQSVRANRDHDRVHRPGEPRRHAGRDARVPDDLRRRHGAVLHDARLETW